MPSNWLYMDTGFPTFTGKETPEEKVSALQNYVYMLLEQLRYTLRNLDLSNMNGAAVEEFKKTITEPIYASIKDTDGNLTQLQLTVQGIGTRVSNAEGNISTLEQTAQSIQSTVQNQAGEISTLQQTASGLQSTVTNLSTTVSGHSGSISSLQQTASSLSSQVSSLDGSVGTLIQQSADWVRFVDLSTGGSTTINGANITTGTIDASKVKVTNAFEVVNGQNTWGYIGIGIGGTDQQGATVGVQMAGPGKSCYVICTGAGARLTAGNSDMYVSTGECRLRPAGPIYLGGSSTTKLCLTTAAYGSSLPSSGSEGQLFFKI